MKSSFTIFLFMTTYVLWSQIEIKIHQDGFCEGDGTLLVAVGGGPNYQWIITDQPDSVISTVAFIEVYPEVTTSYTVYDSTDTATVMAYMEALGAECICRYYIPNHFTPDGDSFNQLFKPIINCDHIGLHMTIYSRGQEVVYDSHEIDQAWDGTHYLRGNKMEDGVYAYQVSFMMPDGELVRLVGFVLLLQ